ncbi:CheR family methyltransferase [Spirosoma sp. KNUC1025]|uniref:CheR family methyltransferase n=1 Tax=Spirosoma sp. KNUC1025 TaxID=2894082 RepID=UPI00386F0664|nr:PAS domain S-box protein [Spirosoma sp. KNUC1025]
MPRSAITEGVVDRVLPPAEIAKELERLSGQISVFQQTTLPESQEIDSEDSSTTESIAGTNEDLRTIIQLLRRATGVDFSYYKVTTIRRRIIRRTLLYKLESLHEYAEYLRRHPEEANLLYDDLLINVTTFFRDADTMDYIQKVLLPQLVREKAPQEPLRIWVPACSTGQEAYSIAMLLLEVLGDRALSRTIQIFATDLSESAVAKARLGSYTRGEIMDVSARRLQRFFTKIDDYYRINKAVRDLCVFAPHNLLKDPPFSRLDLISCRNLLIYLEAPLQRKAIATFHYGLHPNGYLILGKSETVGTSAPLFLQIEKNYKIFSRKNDVDSRATFAMSPRQLDGDTMSNRPSILPRSAGQGAGDTPGRNASGSQDRWAGAASDLDKVVDNLLLNQYVPASVVVNQDLEILSFRGSTGLFLEPSPGKASLNLIKMARPSLVFELRNVVHKAQKLGEPVRKSGLEIKVKNKIHYVAIEAVPLETVGEERMFLILFEEVEPPAVPTTRTADARNRRIKELENELANLREDMRSIIEEQEASNEELQSANEEIISSNEELQSINEELETSKEEIESTNEELLTINQELQVRNDQLSEAYQFAEDIFGTIREATLVLDTDLRVKSANQAFYRLFQLSDESTERRLIYELGNRQWDIPELRLMLTDIITSDAQFQGFELKYSSPEAGEKVLSLNARRVVRQQESILLAIEDITEHRRAQELLAEREGWFRQIANNAPTLIWVTDADGKFTFLNKAWLDYTGYDLDEVMKHGLVHVMHPDDRLNYLVNYNDHITKKEPFQSEYRLYRQDGNYRWMLENAQPMAGAQGDFNGYIGNAVDIQLQKESTQRMDRQMQERTEELAELNQLISIALNISEAGQGRWDWNTNATIWDDRGKEIIGFTSDEEMTKSDGWINRIHPDDRAEVMAHAQEAMQNGTPFLHEYRVIHDDGSIRYVLGSGKMNQDASGQPMGSAGMVIDITGLRLAKFKADLQKAHDRQRAIFEALPLPLSYFRAIRNEDGTIVDFTLEEANQASLQLLTLEQEVNGQTVNQLRVKLIDHPYYQSMITVAETSLAKREEVHTQINGQDAWSLVNTVPFEDGILIASLDITDRKLAEQALDKSKHFVQMTLDSSKSLVQVLEAVRNETGEIIDFRWILKNKIARDVLGDSLQETLLQVTPGLVEAGFFAKCLHVMETGETIRFELNYDQERFPNAYDVTIVKLDDGLVINSLDITDRKAAEMLAQQTTQNLQAVLNSSPAAICFLKPVWDDAHTLINFQLVVCNQQFAEMAEQSVTQLMGQKISQLADKLWHEHTVENIRQVLETGTPFVDEQYNPDKNQWMTIVLNKFDSGVVLMGQNITQLKKAEQQQEHLLNELEKSNENIQVLAQMRQQLRERGEFLRSTSHDLRGNIGIIQGAVTLLDMATSDEERSHMLEMLQRNLRQATQMLSELLDVARLEAGQEQRQIESFDAAQLFHGLVDSLQPFADERGLWLRSEGDEVLLVEGDRVKVHRIAQNLLLNALKYTQTGGVTINWGVAPAADQWLLTITDTGPGLLENDRSKSGEGIGLNIVRQLCGLLDCHMDTDSQPGVGTRFELSFPRRYVA